MTAYQLWLAIGAALSVVLNLRKDDLRLIGWVALAAASFAISTATWRIFGTSGAWPAFVAGLADALCASIILGFRRKKIETLIAWLFLVMLCINVAYLWRLIGPHSAYVFSLELVNWAILALIGGKGLLRWISYGLSSWDMPLGSIDRAIGALERERKTPGYIYRSK